MYSLRSRLTVSYIFIALFCILFTSLLANLFLERQFRQYIKENMERQNKQIVALVSQQYFTGTHSWNVNGVADIGINALEQGLIVKLTDTGGNVIWDATQHNNGLCQQMILHMAHNMSSRYPNWKGSYVVAKYPIIKKFVTAATIEIGYYGPFYFKDTDLTFINTLNRILMGVTVFGVFIALVVGGFTARRLSKPISKVISTAQEIAGGNLKARSLETTHIKEINQLTKAINDLAESLQKQENLRKRLTADLAHELRTPLATVQSHMEAILDGIWKLELPRVKVCYDEVLRISRMVKDLEKLAKYERENLILEKSQFNLADLVRDVIINFESEFCKKKVGLSFGGNDIIITADRDKTNQVLVNLLANSLKFTPKGGKVEVHLAETSDLVVIHVNDTGIGIAADELPFIFERFYRVDKSRNRSTGGSGIGLAIAKAIVEAHHGEIRVESELGVGTEFVVSLPKGIS